METRKLTKIAKALEKQLKRQDKLKKHEQEFVAQKAQPASAQQQ
jgi:ribonuclease D